MTATGCDKLRLSRDKRGLSPRQMVAVSAATGDRLLKVCRLSQTRHAPTVD